jgi:hypothetical protein
MTDRTLEQVLAEMRAHAAQVDRKNMSRPSTYLDSVDTSSIEYWADEIEALWKRPRFTADERVALEILIGSVSAGLPLQIQEAASVVDEMLEEK